MVLHTFFIIILSVFNKNQNHYYHNIFLEKCSYQLAKYHDKKQVFADFFEVSVPTSCNGCHGVLMMPMNLSNIAILVLILIILVLIIVVLWFFWKRAYMSKVGMVKTNWCVFCFENQSRMLQWWSYRFSQ